MTLILKCSGLELGTLYEAGRPGLSSFYESPCPDRGRGVAAAGQRNQCNLRNVNSIKVQRSLRSQAVTVGCVLWDSLL